VRAAGFLVAVGAAVLLSAAPAVAHPLHAATGPLSWPDVLGRSALGTALLWATLPLAGLLLASLWAPRGPRSSSPVWDATLGVALVVAIALLRGERGSGALAFVLILVHLVAAAVWLGGVLELVVRQEDRWATARRFGPVGVGAVVVLVATGVWNVRVHTGGRPLAGSYEHVLGLKLALIVVALGFAVAAHRQLRGRHRVLSRRLVGGEAAALATVVAVAAVLTSLPAAAAGGATVRVARSRNGITVISGGTTFRASGPDSEECASHAAGVLLAGADPRRLPCSLSEPDAPQLGAAFARYFSALRISSAVVMADDSPRSRAMTERFVSDARAQGIAVDVVHAASEVRSWSDAAVVTSGWATAKDVVSAIEAAPAPPVRGVFLAPWLLSSEVTGGPGRVQLAVALPFDPSASTAGAYLDQLVRRAPRATASTAGLDGWLAGRRTPSQPATAIQFFTPARIDFLPPSLSEGHDHAGAAWVNGGQMAAVSGLVRLEL